jgi:hypothetical protein
VRDLGTLDSLGRLSKEDKGKGQDDHQRDKESLESGHDCLVVRLLSAQEGTVGGRVEYHRQEHRGEAGAACGEATPTRTQ